VTDAPEVHLERLRDLRRRREQWAVDYETEEQHEVESARQAGLSWEDIATALGRVRSSVWEKYHE